MLKTDRLERFNWTGKRSINIIVNNEYKTVKVGDYFFLVCGRFKSIY